MRFIFLVKATEDSEAAVMPEQKFIDEIQAYAAQLVQAGVAVSGVEVLRPSSQGFRAAYEDGNFSMVEGPFVESKELIAAYWQIEVASRDEAIAWAKRVPFANGLVEVRQTYTGDDFS